MFESLTKTLQATLSAIMTTNTWNIDVQNKTNEQPDVSW